MINVAYGRISTADQNSARQTYNGMICFVDTCSGSIPFFERPQAKKLVDYLSEYEDVTVIVQSVDRIGRNTLDVLQTVEWFKKNNYNLQIKDLGIDSTSPFFEMMVSLMGTFAQLEKQTIKDRCKQGIEIAKSKGLYEGRKKGTTDSRDKVLKKHADIVLCLKKNMTVKQASELTKKTRVTVYRVKSLL